MFQRAVKAGACERVRYLIRRASTNREVNAACGTLQMRPLMAACYVTDGKKRRSMVQLLLAKGANPTLVDAHGRNAVMYACALALGGVVADLVRNCDFDLNAADENGNTALHFSAMAGERGVLEKMLKEMRKYRLDISVRNCYFLTPLAVALLRGHWDCVQLLHDAGGCPRFSASELTEILQSMKETDKSGSSQSYKSLAVENIITSVDVAEKFSVMSVVNRGKEMQLSVPPLRRYRSLPSTSTPNTNSLLPVSLCQSTRILMKRYSVPACVFLRENPPPDQISTCNLPPSQPRSQVIAKELLRHGRNIPTSLPKLSRSCRISSNAGISYPTSASFERGMPKERAQMRTRTSTAPSRPDYTKTILAQVYPLRTASSYRHSPNKLVPINSKWIETVRGYRPKAPDAQPSKSLLPLSRRNACSARLKRMASSPNFRSNSAGGLGRQRSLSRPIIDI